MKLLALLLASLTLAACSPSYEEITFSAKPAELADCKFYSLRDADGTHVIVARCPHSVTSTSYGKGHRKSVVIDGAEYVEQVK